MKQWKRRQPMAEEEVDFEADDMQVDEGSMLRAHSLVNTQLFEDVAEEEGDTTIGLKAKICKQDASSLFFELSRSTADQPIRVWTEEAETQVYFRGV